MQPFLALSATTANLDEACVVKREGDQQLHSENKDKTAQNTEG